MLCCNQVVISNHKQTHEIQFVTKTEITFYCILYFCSIINYNEHCLRYIYSSILCLYYFSDSICYESMQLMSKTVVVIMTLRYVSYFINRDNLYTDGWMLNKNIQSIEKIQLELSDCFKTFELKFTKYVRLDIRIFFIFNFKYLFGWKLHDFDHES